MGGVPSGVSGRGGAVLLVVDVVADTTISSDGG